MTEVTTSGAAAVALTRRPRGLAPLALGALLPIAVAWKDGGYAQEVWAWTALVTLGIAFVLLILDGARWGVFDIGFAGALGLLAVWTACTATWSSSVPGSLSETVRTLSYLGVVVLALTATRSSEVERLLAGTLVGITAIGLYSLGTRLLPDRLGTFDSSEGAYRLAGPIGYWNGLAIVLVVGMLLALGFATHAATPSRRALAAATVPLLAAATYFTFSRGAWIALGLGLAVAIAFDLKTRVRQLGAVAAIAPTVAGSVLLCANADQLRTTGATLAQASDQGRSLLAPLLLLAAAAGGGALLGTRLASRIRVGRRLRRLARALGVAAVVVALTFGWIAWGSPAEITRSVWHEIDAPESGTANLGDRLFDLSSAARVDQWTVAFDEWKRHPVAGRGGGTYWQVWSEHRPSLVEVQDAHSVYLETLAELGIVGLALLLLVGAVVVTAGIRSRHPLAAAALGAFAAWAAHAGIDWDWELAGVTVPVLLVGAALVAMARTELIPSRAHLALTVCVGALLIPALVSVLGAAPLASARSALASRELADAERHARQARRFAPWASAPWEILGDVAAQRGDLPAARSAYRKAISRDPSSWTLWFALAGVTEGRARSEALARAVELNPRSEMIRDFATAVS